MLGTDLHPRLDRTDVHLNRDGLIPAQVCQKYESPD
jgi:hypothetical protein